MYLLLLNVHSKLCADCCFQEKQLFFDNNVNTLLCIVVMPLCMWSIWREFPVLTETLCIGTVQNIVYYNVTGIVCIESNWTVFTIEIHFLQKAACSIRPHNSGRKGGLIRNGALFSILVLICSRIDLTLLPLELSLLHFNL